MFGYKVLSLTKAASRGGLMSTYLAMLRLAERVAAGESDKICRSLMPVLGRHVTRLNIKME